MVENKVRALVKLDKEIKDLEDSIENIKKENDIIRLNIEKKELMLKKIEKENI